ncbi:MAG: SprT family zinc-dependent metalloprotease [Microbacteriaceae bacterium]|nr:SprT family zinc-dependent metalloprotease [Microbacteriaceae bacterium]
MAELALVTAWAQSLIRTHLDPVFGRGVWTFGFDHAKRRAGLCNYAKKRISVSRYLAVKHSEHEVYQTLLHEVAHALAGHEAGHGAQWRRIARDLGYVGGRTHSGEIAHEHASWIGACPAGHEHARFRRPTRETSCGKCSTRFDRAHLIRWQRRHAA